jgi:hypothetical protein
VNSLLFQCNCILKAAYNKKFWEEIIPVLTLQYLPINCQLFCLTTVATYLNFRGYIITIITVVKQ